MLTEVMGGFNQPILVKSEPADPTRLYVVEQGGIITLLDAGGETVFLDISAIVQAGGEQGLLGFAFHPDYETNGRFFVHYTDDAGDTAVAEYARDPNNPDAADPTSGNVFFQIDDFATNHNGGALEFGPDGFLYLSMGDGGGGGDPNETGQDLNSHLGKILRFDIDPMSDPYEIPPGNAPGGLPEIWDWGVRNPWRTSFDACTGDLYIADVGQNAWEEVNIEPAGMGNKNYGWDCREGMHDYETENCQGGFTEPLLEYSHSDGCSVSGGYVYRGSAIPWLRGTYFYADYCNGRIWTTTFDGTSATPAVERSADLESSGMMNISSFGQDSSGEIYVVDHGGTIYRIDAE